MGCYIAVVYDQARNEAYVTVGTSRDTSEFACDSLRHWWYNYTASYTMLMRLPF
ncbi:ISAzo13-like element transposase-related protein [Bathymodiolus platifrons methanotrophic gill symbiont]|uniref:ISAzo13-like element transposase-related protein n=1 Tax=Bathymodiolus platifrons methanotrophic gill symbiont TaxID=113268 RepID=UPI001E5CD9F2|nr:hypothetical protein [Bathymodiolus platifrons methanotrophic gill symbiont]